MGIVRRWNSHRYTHFYCTFAGLTTNTGTIAAANSAATANIPNTTTITIPPIFAPNKTSHSAMPGHFMAGNLSFGFFFTVNARHNNFLSMRAFFRPM